MDDFIFGSMDTDALRLKHHKELHAGIAHFSMRNPKDPRPGQPVTLSINVGQLYEAVDAWVYYSTDGIDPEGDHGKPIHGCVERMQWVGAEWDDLTWGYVHHFECSLPGQPDQTVVRYRICILTADGQLVYADHGTYYAYAVDQYQEPGWVKDTVIYHIMLDRFATQSGKTWNKVNDIEEIFGGDLKGLQSKLDYLCELGVNTLYLSPIFPSGNHHRYNATDYFVVDPLLGTLEDFKNLLDDVHQRNMRLILDFVPNHWSDQHVSFRSAVSDPQSPYRNWYKFTQYPDQYERFFDVASMPKVNLRDPQARKHMIDAACYWLELGVDGLRLDYAVGPTPDFWADFRLATRKANPDCWAIGEVVDSIHAQLAFEGLLDGCLDFVLLEALRQTFATRAWPVWKFVSFLQGHQAVFPLDFSRPCFLDNHDMDRFLWGAGNDKEILKMAAMCQFTLSGSPMIYYGTEVGLTQVKGTRDHRGGFGKLEEARLPMPWDDSQDKSLLKYYQDLISLRNREDVLRTGNWTLIKVTENCFCYSRNHSQNSLLCLFNLSSQTQRMEIPEPWSEVILATRAIHNGERKKSNWIDVEPMTGMILK